MLTRIHMDVYKHVYIYANLYQISRDSGISVTLVFFRVVNIYAMLKKFGMYACLSQGDDLNIPLGIVYFADGIM